MDGDGDGVGGAAATTDDVRGVAIGGDCDDADPSVHPGARERCDAIDRDCDGQAGLDDPDNPDRVEGFRDADGDGFGSEPVRACPDLQVGQSGDCDDGDPSIHPAAAEVCDGVDQDCDGIADDGVLSSYFEDRDADGWGAAEVRACAAPAGHVQSPGDCDDRDPRVHPGAPEVCDRLDNDCNGFRDSGDAPLDGRPVHVDADGDGVGAGPEILGCPGEPGFAELDGDCDDLDPRRTPGAEEVCDGVDNDCDAHPDGADDGFEGSPLGCDQCPELAAAPLQVQSVNPCLLDAEATYGCYDGVYLTDTHDQGWRLHWAVRRSDTSLHRPGILLYLPPAGAQHTNTVPQWAAELGFRTVVLDWYPSTRSVTKTCEDAADVPLCFDDVMHEVVFGDDLTDAITLAPGNNVERELDHLLAHLEATDPGQGWGTVRQIDGSLDWAEIHLMAWSKGASPGSILAQDRSVASFTILGPRINADRLIYTRPWATPAERFRLVGHVYEWTLNQVEIETVAGASTGADFTDPVDLDSDAWPWSADAAAFTTASGLPGPSCTPHAFVASDDCMDVSVLGPAYRNLICAL